MTLEPVEDLAAATRAAGDLVADVRHEQWGAPTPCPEWNVRELVNHVVSGTRLFTGILRGDAIVGPDALDPKAGDTLGDNPASAYRKAAEELLAAFRQPGVLEQFFDVPVGTVPGVVALHLRTVEELVHGWDLAQATGQQTRFGDDTVERAIEFSLGKLADVPPERSPFAPPQPVLDHAPPLDRLVAMLGREVDLRR